MSEPDLEAIRARKDGPWDAPSLGGVWTNDEGGGWITTDAEDADAEFIADMKPSHLLGQLAVSLILWWGIITAVRWVL